MKKRKNNRRNNKYRRVGGRKDRDDKALKMESKSGERGGEKRLQWTAEISNDKKNKM